MEEAIKRIEKTFLSCNYTQALDEIYKYLSVENVKLDISIIKIYIECLIKLNLIDRAYYEIESAIKMFPDIYSDEQLARRYIYCDKIDLAEKIIKNGFTNDKAYYRVSVSYLLHGYYNYAKYWFEKFISISDDEEDITRARGYLREIHNYFIKGEFVPTNYLKFKRDGYSLEPGHIFYSKHVDLGFEDDRKSSKPYMVWKVENNNVYCFPVVRARENEKKYNYILRKEKYPNYTFNRKVKDSLACVDEKYIEKIVSVVKYFDYQEVIACIYRSICFTNDTSACEKFFYEYIKEMDIQIGDIVSIPNCEKRQIKLYYIVDMFDDSYRALKIENNNGKYCIENNDPIILKRSDYLMKAFINKQEKKEEIQKQLKASIHKK